MGMAAMALPKANSNGPKGGHRTLAGRVSNTSSTSFLLLSSQTTLFSLGSRRVPTSRFLYEMMAG